MAEAFPLSLDHIGTALEIKTVDRRQRLISGFAAYHSNVDRVADIIDPSASVKAVNRLSSPADVAVFVGHQANTLPVGIPQKIEATPEGLYTETYILKGPVGDNLLDVAEDLMAHGQKLGMSIGYQPLSAKPERSSGKLVRRLMDYGLQEYSYAASQMIANPRALATGVKALAEGSDTAGGFAVPADDEGKAAMKPKVEKRGDKFHVVGADGVSMGSYDTEAAAQAACDMHGAGKSGKTWDAAYINDLPDSAFLTIETGGRVDDEGKTVPRSLRHFPVRDDEGQVDTVQIKMALDGIPTAGAWLDDQQKTRLLARARTLLDGGEDWKTGAPLDIRGFAYRLLDLSDALAAEHKAMTLLGESTKDGHRIRSEMRVKLATVSSDLTKAIEWSELIDKGEDGLARLALLARELDLLEA